MGISRRDFSGRMAAALTLGIAGTVGCGGDVKAAPSVREDGMDRERAIESIRRDVERLATAEGRVCGTEGHARAREYLLKRIKELGLEGYNGGSPELPYKMGGEKFVNVVAQLPGRKPELPPVVLVAHYDTCGVQPGADDNAAAIAILLASVEDLRAHTLDRTVVSAFFDAEEPPRFLTNAMGSTYFYRHQRKGEVHCAIVLDLVGHDVALPGLEDVVFLTGMETDKDFAATVRACEPRGGGLRTVPTLNRYVGDMSDHHVFRVERRPYLFLSCGRWEHYHAPTDTPEKLNYAKIALLRDYVVALTLDVSRRALEGPFEGYDSTQTELHFLKDTVGPIVEALGLSLETRSDIDVVARALQAQFDL